MGCTLPLIFYSIFYHTQSQPLESKGILIILLFISVARSLDIFELWFDAQIKSKYNAVIRSIVFLIVCLFRVVAIYTDAPLTVFAISYTLEFLLVSLLQYYFFRQVENDKSKLSVDFKSLYLLVKKSFPILLTDMCVITYMRSGQIYLGHLYSPEILGEYSAALKLVELWYFIPSILITTFFSTLITTRINFSDEVFILRMKRMYTLLTFISISIAITVTLLAPLIITVFLGKSYINASSTLAILIWGNIFYFWGIAQDIWDFSFNLIKYRLLRVFLGLTVNTIGNITLIPLYGVTGAAISSVLSYFTSYCLAYYLNPKSRNLFYIEMRSLLFWRDFKLYKEELRQMLKVRN